MPNPKNESCKNCRFWESRSWADAPPTAEGDCRRYPPVVDVLYVLGHVLVVGDQITFPNFDPDDDSAGYQFTHSVTDEIMWCGEWRPQ